MIEDAASNTNRLSPISYRMWLEFKTKSNKKNGNDVKVLECIEYGYKVKYVSINESAGRIYTQTLSTEN